MAHIAVMLELKDTAYTITGHDGTCIGYPGPPPPLPTTPKPKTAITKVTLQDSGLPRRGARIPHNQSLSQLCRIYLEGSQCPVKSNFGNNRRIRRRHSEKHNRKLTELTEGCPRTLPVELRKDTICLTVTPAVAWNCKSDSPHNQGEFVRNSPVRRAKHRRPRQEINSRKQMATEKLDSFIKTETLCNDIKKRTKQKEKTTTGLGLSRLFQKMLLA